MTADYLPWRSLKTIPSLALRIWHFFLANELRWVWGLILSAWILILVAEIAGYGHLLHHKALIDDSIPLVAAGFFSYVAGNDCCYDVAEFCTYAQVIC